MGFIIPAAHIAHHTPKVTLCNDTFWIKMFFFRPVPVILRVHVAIEMKPSVIVKKEMSVGCTYLTHTP